MKRLAVLAVAVCGAIAAQNVVETKPNPAEVTVKVDAAARGEVIPAELFGSFLEPIGNSINNGLAAQILVNPSLEGGLWNHVNLENLYKEEPDLIESANATGIPLPWMAWDRKAGNRYELHVGAAANSWQSLELLGTPKGPAGMMQRVYLPVHRELKYNVSAFVKHVAGPAKVTFALRSLDGRKIAEASVEAASSTWEKYTATLAIPQGMVKPLEKVEFGAYVGAGVSRAEVDQITLMPADAVDGLDPDAVKLAKAMGMTELRFGGNFSSYYHWKDGMGDPDKRVTMENIAWGIPEYNNFGTDEFLALCKRLGVVPQFNLNMGSGSPQEATEWVRYIKAHYKEHIIWEIGNELYGNWQVGAPSLDQLPARTLAFSKVVRAEDPGATLIATGESPMDYERWNGAQYTLPAGAFDMLSLHFIEGNGRMKFYTPRTDESAQMDYAKTYLVGAQFPKILAQANATPHKGKVHFAMTEWLFNSRGPGERNFTNNYASWMNQGGAVLCGGFFNTLLRHTDAMKLADMTGMMEFAGIWKKKEQVYGEPSYYTFQMYSSVKGDTVLPAQTDSGSYQVNQTAGVFAVGGKVPYVDVVATRSADGSRVTLLAVNRALKPVKLKLDLAGFAAKSEQVTQIAAANRYERNTEEQPEHIRPVTETGTVGAGLEFPAESVMKVVLTR